MSTPTPPLQALYQEVILQHYRKPRNRGEMEDADAEISINNPTCGDEITLQLKLDDDRIADVRFRGHGCSISQASASMMSEHLKGASLADAAALQARFTEMLHGDAEAARDKSLGDLRSLAGVSRFPVRIRCALLAWEALQRAGAAVRS